MMNIENMETLGLKQMHTVQVEALLEFIQDAINLAALTQDPEIVLEVEHKADQMIRLFGGNGVSVTFEEDH
jgi:hypothetical protein